MSNSVDASMNLKPGLRVEWRGWWTGRRCQGQKCHFMGTNSVCILSSRDNVPSPGESRVGLWGAWQLPVEFCFDKGGKKMDVIARGKGEFTDKNNVYMHMYILTFLIKEKTYT